MGKKILVIGHAFIVEANRKVWSELAEAPGHIVDLVAPRSWTSNLIGGVQLDRSKKGAIREIFPVDTYFTGNGSFYFYKLVKMFKILNSNQYDTLIINQEGWSLSLLFINLLKIFSKSKKAKIYLMIAQNIKKDNLKWAIPLEKFNMMFVHKLLGCCNETEDVVRWKGIKTPWSYFPLYYGEGLETIKKVSKEDSKLIIGYIGRVSEEKGIDSLLGAFSKLQEDLNIELVIAGAGDLVSELERPGVEYMGVLGHNQVHKFYEKIDVLILPSLTRKFWKEQFGRVIVESVASGRVVIGSDSGAIPEVLGHLGLNYIFKEGDEDSIVEQVKRYLNERSQIDFSQIQKKNKEMFSIEAFAKRTKGLLNEV
jgi:glycosyltransferase involved in cell wall biosynthesis